jgi:hypothetical protein
LLHHSYGLWGMGDRSDSGLHGGIGRSGEKTGDFNAGMWTQE